MATYRIWDNVHYDPPQYMKTYNTSTGEVTSISANPLEGYMFPTQPAQAAAITLINGYSQSFVGSAPPPPRS